MGDTPVSVALIVVAYDDADTIPDCLRSVRAGGFDGPIVVVDNASHDTTASVLATLTDELDGVVVVTASHNGGYAAGFNLGCRAVDAEFYAVMNADCTVEGDWVSVCVDFLTRRPTAAVACPTVVLGDRSGINAEGLTLHKAGFGFNRNLGHPIATAATTPTEVGGVQGTAFVIRAEVLDRIGGWSETGFLYHEDVELGWAVAAIGMQVWHVPTPHVIHDYVLTMSPEKFFLLERNRIEMLGAYLGWRRRVLLAPVLLATEVAVWVYAMRKRSGLVGAKWRSHRAAMQRRAIRQRRRTEVDAFRTVSDRRLVSAMALSYPRDQTRTLMEGSTTTGRRGDRELPTA